VVVVIVVTKTKPSLVVFSHATLHSRLAACYYPWMLLASLIGLQVFSRLITFALNQTLVRIASPLIYGAASVQFDLVLGTILFLSREGTRAALLRSLTPGRDRLLALGPILLGGPMAVFVGVGYARFWAGEEVRRQDGFGKAVMVYVIAALVELMAEPFYNEAVWRRKVGERVRIEGAAVVSRTMVTLALLLLGKAWMSPLEAFASGQLVYALVLFGGYVVRFGSAWDGEWKWKEVNRETKRLVGVMMAQSLLKHVLTEGDRMVLSTFPLDAQGAYALSSAYGALLARMVFQPVEESLRLSFTSTVDKGKGKTGTKTLLTMTLRIYAAFSILLVTFAPPFLPLFIPLLLPPSYLTTSAPRILSLYPYYIPLLAFNGALEAFFASMATPPEVNGQSRMLTLLGVGYVLGCWAGRGLGGWVLVLGNMVNLAGRVVWCWCFAKKYFRDSEGWTISDVSPPKAFLLVVGFSRLLMFLVQFWLFGGGDGWEAHVEKLGRRALMDGRVLSFFGMGGVLGLVCLGVWWLSGGRKVIGWLRGVDKGKKE